MTDKEAIDFIKAQIDLKMASQRLACNLGYPEAKKIEESIEMYNYILKSLEILEILKKHLKEDGYYNGGFIDFTELTEEEKEKMGELMK